MSPTSGPPKSSISIHNLLSKNWFRAEYYFFPLVVLFYVHKDTTQFPSLGGSSASSSLQSQWGETPKPRGCNVMLCASNPLASFHDRVSRVTNRSETGDPSALKTPAQRLFIRQRGFYFERTRSLTSVPLPSNLTRLHATGRIYHRGRQPASNNFLGLPLEWREADAPLFTGPLTFFLKPSLLMPSQPRQLRHAWEK